ncbi:MAG: thymidine phosphorylase, partial [Alphaproteobacteria bacterium]|nr:thymidine phosphorylase [Alphaproteobacteria bacterium]
LLTQAMMRSGKVLDWSSENLTGPVLDKHSTGGVGDNISLILAPAIAACGAHVPMISGRGLGHTGGTLDKLSAIPGYRSDPDEQLFRTVVREIGCAIIGQTDELAPADRKLYAIRDVTATVESIALVTSSILSKKLAAGLQGLVMDVKTGSGAFMQELEQSRVLAKSIVNVAGRAGLPTRALITDMDQPLAHCAGNAIEVQHALDHLTGVHRQASVHEVVLALGAHMLHLGGLAPTLAAASDKVDEAIRSGKAAEIFARMCARLGGPSDLLSKSKAYLKIAPISLAVQPKRKAYVKSIDTRAIGLAIVRLGGGRTRHHDAIDTSVGFSQLAMIGDHVSPEQPLAIIHAHSSLQAESALAALEAAYQLSEEPIAAKSHAVLETILADVNQA